MSLKFLHLILYIEQLLSVIILLNDLFMESMLNPPSENIRVVLRFQSGSASVTMRPRDFDMNSSTGVGRRTNGIERGGMLSQKLDMILCVVSCFEDGLGALLRSSMHGLDFDFDFLVEAF